MGEGGKDFVTTEYSLITNKRYNVKGLNIARRHLLTRGILKMCHVQTKHPWLSHAHTCTAAAVAAAGLEHLLASV